jgi:hypothetical protein
MWFSFNKTDYHDITEILLKVALNTINQTEILLKVALNTINQTEILLKVALNTINQTNQSVLIYSTVQMQGSS